MRSCTTHQPRSFEPVDCFDRGGPAGGPGQTKRGWGGELAGVGGKVSHKALPFCCASTAFLSKTAPFLAVRLHSKLELSCYMDQAMRLQGGEDAAPAKGGLAGAPGWR
eukprot:SAG22_NODE_2281_length_2760_cov_21.201052_4_plen_108_part_00